MCDAGVTNSAIMAHFNRIIQIDYFYNALPQFVMNIIFLLA